MSRPIKEGDTIRAFWGSDAHRYDEMVGVVQSMPAATGDFLYLKTEKGELFAINTSSNTLEGLELIKEAPDA